MAPPNDVAAQLRRRRAASYRCRVLVCGRRDPIDPSPRPAVEVEPLRDFANELVLVHGFTVDQARLVLR